MAIIAKFKALRPVRDKVHLVATRPYYSYKKNVLKAKMETNPWTLLNIINPEFDQSKKTKTNSTERFELVKKGYNQFVEDGILIQDTEPKLYLYKQTTEKHSCIGIIAGASVEEYLAKKIKIHEATLTTREAVFEHYLDVVGYNAEPVLLSYSGNKNIQELIEDIALSRPEYEFTTTDKIKHELWILQNHDADKIQAYFEPIKEVYIADGHHRSASSAGLYKSKGNQYEYSKNFLAYFVDEQQLNISSFNRIIKSLNNINPKKFLEKISKLGSIERLDRGIPPALNHTLHFLINEAWYALTIDRDLIDENHPVKSLDSSLLTELILKPILGIENIKTSKEIDFLPGTLDADVFAQELKKKRYALGIMLFPISISQIKAVADAGLYMPPKSTWVEPKLRSGLTIYNLKE